MTTTTDKLARSRRLPRRLPGALALLAVAAVVASCSSTPSTAPTTTTPSTTTTPQHRARVAPTTPTTVAPPSTLSPPPIPATGAYLGAWINPAKAAGAGNSGAALQGQLPSFVAQVGRPLGIVSLYAAFNAPLPTSVLNTIVADGSIPMISWGCASTAAITAGQEDSVITAYAQALKAFGHPVLLRWFWEMNLQAITKNAACLGSGGAPGFVAAWQHIWNIFQQVGASNVALVWCPGVSSGLTRMEPFFPGASYVDWIGADGYDRQSTGAAAFSQVFGPWYGAYASYAKPMMIGETGAMPADQAAYIQGMAAQLPTSYPEIKALIYFDAPAAGGAWQLTASGAAAFAALARAPYFSARA